MLKRVFKKDNLKETAFLLLLLAAALSVALSKNSQSAVKEGVMLWAAVVLPALFPYLVITQIMSALKITGKIAGIFSPAFEKVFNVNGHCGYALFLSLMSGYPVGAKCVSDLKQKGLIGDAESVRAATLCSSSSPVFIIGSVGNLTFNNPFFGLMLFVTHLLSVLTVGFLFSFYKRKERPEKPQQTNFNRGDNLLYESVYQAVISVLVVGGIITVFYLVTEMLTSLGALKPLTDFLGLITDSAALKDGIANGLFECTKGLKILASGGISLYTLPVAAGICGFGGLSVIMQSVAYLKKAKIKTAPFLLSKTLSAVVNFILGLIFSALFLA